MKKVTAFTNTLEEMGVDMGIVKKMYYSKKGRQVLISLVGESNAHELRSAILFYRLATEPKLNAILKEALWENYGHESTSAARPSFVRRFLDEANTANLDNN